MNSFVRLSIFILCLMSVACQKSEKLLLIEAAEKGDEKIVGYLLQKGVSYASVDELGYTPLMKAAAKNQKEVVQLLLKHGADIDAKSIFDTTALSEAVWYGHLEMVKILVKNGADIKIRSVGGWGIMHFAVSSRCPQPEMVIFLVQSGAATDIKDHIGWTPLQWLAPGKHSARIEEILKNFSVK